MPQVLIKYQIRYISQPKQWIIQSNINKLTIAYAARKQVKKMGMMKKHIVQRMIDYQSNYKEAVSKHDISYQPVYSWVRKYYTITAALRRKVILQLCRVCTIKYIVHDLFISETTVQRVLRNLADQFQLDWNYLPQKNLCINELKSMSSAQGTMSFIAVDDSKKGLSELLEDRRLRSLFEHY